jgi:hypothetical protein
LSSVISRVSAAHQSSNKVFPSAPANSLSLSRSRSMHLAPRRYLQLGVALLPCDRSTSRDSSVVDEARRRQVPLGSAPAPAKRRPALSAAHGPPPNDRSRFSSALARSPPSPPPPSSGAPPSRPPALPRGIAPPGTTPQLLIVGFDPQSTFIKCAVSGVAFPRRNRPRSR